MGTILTNSSRYPNCTSTCGRSSLDSNIALKMIEDESREKGSVSFSYFCYVFLNAKEISRGISRWLHIGRTDYILRAKRLCFIKF